MSDTYRIQNKEYTVSGFIPAICGEKSPKNICVPVVSVPMMSDYKFMMISLQDRLEHPEKYEDRENVTETIREIRQWLSEHQIARC